MSNYLYDRRIEIGLTQKEVASFVGVSEATVSRWESGNIANMRRDRIILYAQALQTTTSFIMTGINGDLSENPSDSLIDDFELSAEDAELIRLFRAASPEKRAAILELLK